MFENSNASRASGHGLQTSRLNQASSRRSLVTANPAVGTGPAEVSFTATGGQQRLKNALNLGKAVGAKVNDLLRRKEPSLIGDIGVTEVNKNVGAVWSNVEMNQSTTANSHVSPEAFPRLEPPPPGKKRQPRALKTTQDMMISSDPVVTTPPGTPDQSLLSSPEKTRLISEEERAPPQGERSGEDDSGRDGLIGTLESESEEEEMKMERKGSSGMDVEEEAGEESPAEEEIQLQLSVPDLIHKDQPDPHRAKMSEPSQKESAADTRRASTP
ncbi:hypothetical protein DPEC_G00340080 [Dallia pectoralis]|uniref:Uncharacterized protein n=1 Tax=Dallia pectoralis TaxID=75939 RepID=A0ACC2F523_DALPE|nr:hypothetical protein DPEC_G00340080 [Dallia pectoralis]